MAEYGPCLLVVWRGADGEAALVSQTIEDLSRRFGGHGAYVCIVEAGFPISALRTLPMSTRWFGCMATLMEGEEDRTAVARSVLTSMALLRAQSQAVRVFKELSDLTRWVAAQVKRDLSPERLARAVEILRRQKPSS